MLEQPEINRLIIGKKISRMYRRQKITKLILSDRKMVKELLKKNDKQLLKIFKTEIDYTSRMDKTKNIPYSVKKWY